MTKADYEVPFFSSTFHIFLGGFGCQGTPRPSCCFFCYRRCCSWRPYTHHESEQPKHKTLRDQQNGCFSSYLEKSFRHFWNIYGYQRVMWPRQGAEGKVEMFPDFVVEDKSFSSVSWVFTRWKLTIVFVVGLPTAQALSSFAVPVWRSSISCSLKSSKALCFTPLWTFSIKVHDSVLSSPG